MKPLLHPLAVGLLLAATGLAGVARAQTTTLHFYSHNVNTGVMWHPAENPGDGTSGSCSVGPDNVQRDSFPFYTNTSADTYSLHLYYESFQSGYVYLYRDTFAPEDPCAGIFVFGYAPLANIYDIHLDALRQYYFVTSEDELFIGGGSFQASIYGPTGAVITQGMSPGATTAGEPGTPPPALALAVAPNPVAAHAAVTLTLDHGADVTVAVYDALGRRVATLADGVLAAGPHPLDLDAAGLPAGAYLVRATGDGVALAHPLTVAH